MYFLFLSFSSPFFLDVGLISKQDPATGNSTMQVLMSAGLSEDGISQVFRLICMKLGKAPLAARELGLVQGLNYTFYILQ